MRLLIIEDNQDLAISLLEYFSEHDHVVDTAGDGLTGLHLAVVNEYDAIILDIMLPGMDGLKLCRKLREQAGKTTPILILTARDTLDDKIIGLDAGADDYMVKPFALREVEARLRSIVRRTQPQGVLTVLTVGDLIFDTTTFLVTRADQRIELPPIPLKLLELLMRRSPKVVSKSEMEAAIWGDDPPDSDVLKTHLHVLRNAIDKPYTRDLLHTVRGIGYRLVADSAPLS
ncbi:MAG: response regulator transcription factor [Magnetococcales bacterium]|nr:response regulator transcription factor [Magnetococcales bacterium]MBF0420344.1 response regulator transcription factor [Magnetococcales bacterium]